MMHKYTLGKLLQEQLTKPTINVVKISRWAEHIRFLHMAELAPDLLDILDMLAFMELGPEFQLTSDEIKAVRKKNKAA